MKNHRVGAFYERLHESYFPLLPESAHPLLRSDRFTKSLNLMKKCEPEDVLEVGFENPILSESAAKFVGAKWVGVDVSKAAVEAARRRGLSAFWVDVARESLPFQDGSFDLVYCSEVLEHLYDPDFATEEFKRVLRPTGRILITTPNLASWYDRLTLLLGLQPIHSEVSTWRILGRRFAYLGQGNRPVGHIRLFTLPALTDFLELHDFEILELVGYALELRRAFRLVDRCMSAFPSLASGFVVLAGRD